MMMEMDVFGLLAPGLLVCMAVAGVLCLTLRLILSRAGFYREVWHPALFDLAIYVVAVSLVVSLTAEMLP